ncbi:hypothetical protein BAUCODRAFT_299438 [Baudoinia panamericana UAMH 10762]|uniref:RBR-type E3 ubiquitin transferase n=1 Tax=Baudoinia panamericana (strain UAMH 10762) TaxID=717646 RepID=M2M4U9_BAUPA|nr:uncharacterized protein BAUCODRAFT_299438 [Baudoinia panamericana UAMH 10762]EMC91631.1 hypothetical protein BAUCODRAFT_299438 [Baudoinia panamericana UAMH 10762]
MKRKTCLTCDRHLPANAFPKINEECQHERETCRRCWYQWLALQLETKQWDQITCAQCPTKLGQADIRALAKPAVYTKYLEAEIRGTMAAEESFRWCLNPECKSGQAHFDGDIFTCASCGHKACVGCNAPWHEGETCEAYQDRINEGERKRRQVVEEQDSAKAVERVAKLCPACGRKLEKNGGCDHMTCQICRHEFCWSCLAHYSPILTIGNSAHEESCRYHSRNLPGYRPALAMF